MNQHEKDRAAFESWNATKNWSDQKDDAAAYEGFQAALKYARPDGFVLVPREPTEQMLAHACMYDTTKRDAETDQWNRDTWNLMIAAAPKGDQT